MFAEENQQLLDTLQNQNTEENPESPSAKPGTKASLIQKIRELQEKHSIIVEESNTVLKRKSKKELQSCLAGYVEKAMQQEIRKKLRCDAPEDCTEEQQQQLMAVSVLRMMHDSLARLAETGTKSFTPFQIDGFTESLKAPGVSEQIDECLLAIAKENEILEQIQSPYVRLMICWSGGIAQNLRKKQSHNIKHYVGNTRTMEPRKPQTACAIRPVAARVQKDGQKLCNDLPRGDAVKRV